MWPAPAPICSLMLVSLHLRREGLSRWVECLGCLTARLPSSPLFPGATRDHETVCGHLHLREDGWQGLWLVAGVCRFLCLLVGQSFLQPVGACTPLPLRERHGLAEVLGPSSVEVRIDRRHLLSPVLARGWAYGAHNLWERAALAGAEGGGLVVVVVVVSVIVSCCHCFLAQCHQSVATVPAEQQPIITSIGVPR